MKREWLSLRQLAGETGVHPSTIGRWIAAGELEAHRFGSRLRIHVSAWDRFKEAARVVPHTSGDAA